MPLPSSIVRSKFGFEPTRGQDALFKLLDNFLDKSVLEPILVVKGYAGTGKTSLVPAIVKTLPLFNFSYLLMAPTGRAAKVMSGYSKRVAFTIHKIIYKQVANPETGILQFNQTKNTRKQTVFVVDEASMLSGKGSFGESGVLADLINYVFTDKSNRLILIGDDAQLPPVGQERSDGLNIEFLKKEFKDNIFHVELTEVMRQQETSGILYNATYLRNQIAKEDLNVQFKTYKFQDFFKMKTDKMEDGIRYAYDKYGTEGSIVICRSNRAAVQYNNYIRTQILYFTEELEAGDQLMVVRNNYFYVSDETPSGFIANGDFVEVVKIVSFEDMYGLRFATLELVMPDFPELRPFEAKIILDTLHEFTPALSEEANRNLYSKVLESYEDLTTKKELNEALRKDPYLNALQVKFSYAVTCHKSQGGQWEIVFVDQGYLTEEMMNKEFLRWLYTAITRATKQLFLVNFNNRFFS